MIVFVFIVQKYKKELQSHWLNWQLKGDEQAAKLFKGSDYELQKRKDWTLEKNALFE